MSLQTSLMQLVKLLSGCAWPQSLIKCIINTGPLGMARLLRQTDSQLFCGWREYASLYDVEIMTSRVQLSILKARAHHVCFSCRTTAVV